MCCNKIKNKKYHTIRTILKSKVKIIERGTIYTPNTQIHDLSLSWLGTGTSILIPPNTQIHDITLSWLGTGTSIKSGRLS